jgi:hypothetical protein
MSNARATLLGRNSSRTPIARPFDAPRSTKRHVRNVGSTERRGRS